MIVYSGAMLIGHFNFLMAFSSAVAGNCGQRNMGLVVLCTYGQIPTPGIPFSFLSINTDCLWPC